MDMSMVGGIVSSLNAATTIAKGFIELRDAHQVQLKVIELQSIIIEVQGRVFELDQDRSRFKADADEAKKEVERLTTWGAEKLLYEMVSLDQGSGTVFVRTADAPAEPPHWLCAQCFNGGHKSIVQDRGQTNKNTITHSWRCNRCGDEMHLRLGITPRHIDNERKRRAAEVVG